MGLEIIELTKKYGERTVVDHLSFSLKKPGVYALLGRNGAGKTTSIRMILGMLHKDSGSVLWNGKPIEEAGPKTGYLAEERGLYPKYSIMDQLLYFSALKGIGKKEALEKIRFWGNRLELNEYLYPKDGKGKSRMADQLSKGNQQKVQMAAALIGEPELIILDEPLSGLDPVNADLFKSVIQDEVAKGKFIIMSSHQMSIIEEFCEDVTILNRGKAVLQGNINEIKHGYGHSRLYIQCVENIVPLALEKGLKLLNSTPGGDSYEIAGEEMAFAFLKELVDRNYHVIRFDLREPSLHELFVELTGNGSEEKNTEDADAAGVRQ